MTPPHFFRASRTVDVANWPPRPTPMLACPGCWALNIGKTALRLRELLRLMVREADGLAAGWAEILHTANGCCAASHLVDRLPAEGRPAPVGRAISPPES